MKTKTVLPKEQHHNFRNEVINLLKKYAGRLDASEMLALCAHLTGQMIALQDQRKLTPAEAMELVGKNIEKGNQEAVADHGLRGLAERN
jgi:hypothetical protein